MFVKLFLKELSCLLKKTCITYIAIFGSAFVCLCLCACASLFYTVEQEMMWCLRITGIFFFAGAILFCMFFQFFVYVRRFTSTVIGNERYLTFSVPTSLYSVVSAKILATLVGVLLYFLLTVSSAVFLAALSDDLNYVLSFIMMFLGNIDYLLSFVFVLFFFSSQILAAFFSVCNNAEERYRKIVSVFVFAGINLIGIFCVAVIGLFVHIFAPYAFNMGDSTLFFSWVPSLIIIGVCAAMTVVLYFLLCGRLKKRF